MIKVESKSVDNTHISCETYQQFLVDAVPRCQSCYQNGCSHLKNVIRIVRNSKHCKIAQSWRLFISRHWNTSTYFKHSSGSTNVIKQGWAVSLEYVTLEKPEQAIGEKNNYALINKGFWNVITSQVIGCQWCKLSLDELYHALLV